MVFLKPGEHMYVGGRTLLWEVVCVNRNSEVMYWQSNKDWYEIDDEKDTFVIREDAPERAKKSFEMWKELQVRHAKHPDWEM